MQTSFLIKGGTVVDGTGAPAFAGNFPGEHIVPLTGGDLPLAQAAE